MVMNHLANTNGLGPTVWNTLPSTLRVSTTTLGQFQSGVKTILLRDMIRRFRDCLGR